MDAIYKIGNDLYFEGKFTLRSKEKTNWATPIDCPTIFEAKGAGIKSGNWRSCTAINTPQYVIDNYLNGKIARYMPKLTNKERFEFWKIAKEIEKYNKWETVSQAVTLCNQANELINKLDVL